MSYITVLTVPERDLPAVRSRVQARMKYFNAEHAFHHSSGRPPLGLLQDRNASWLVITPLSSAAIAALAGHDNLKFEHFDSHREKHAEFLKGSPLGMMQLHAQCWDHSMIDVVRAHIDGKI